MFTLRIEIKLVNCLIIVTHKHNTPLHNPQKPNARDCGIKPKPAMALFIYKLISISFGYRTL